MNRALLLFDGPFVIPLCQVNWSFFTIVSGGVFFEEFQQFTLEQLLLFATGVCLNFSGVTLLQPKSKGFRLKALPWCHWPSKGRGVAPADKLPAGAMTSQSSHTPGEWRSRQRPTPHLQVDSTESVPRFAGGVCPHISVVGMIPLVLGGFQSEQVRKDADSFEKHLDDEVESGRPRISDTLIQIEQASAQRDAEILIRINELTAAVQGNGCGSDRALRNSGDVASAPQQFGCLPEPKARDDHGACKDRDLADHSEPKAQNDQCPPMLLE